jgi:hypothetical protein
MSQVCNDNISTLISVLASGFLIISEALPYLKIIKGNGILDAVVQAIKKPRGEVDHERQVLYDALE